LPLGKLLLELNKNEEAIEFIKLAAEKGSAEGQFELGMLFAYGHGCARDEAKARRWLNRAKNQGLSLQPKSDEKDIATDNWVEKKIDFAREVLEFEAQKQLKTKGMSILERKKRFVFSELDATNPAPDHPATSAYLEFIDAFPPGKPACLSPYIQNMKDITSECWGELVSRAKNGSVTAQSFFKACELLNRAIYLLKQQQTYNK